MTYDQLVSELYKHHTKHKQPNQKELSFVEYRAKFCKLNRMYVDFNGHLCPIKDKPDFKPAPHYVPVDTNIILCPKLNGRKDYARRVFVARLVSPYRFTKEYKKRQRVLNAKRKAVEVERVKKREDELREAWYKQNPHMRPITPDTA